MNEWSNFTFGATLGFSTTLALLVQWYRYRHLLKAKLSDATFNQKSITSDIFRPKELRNIKLDIELIVDSHIEIIKRGFKSNEIELSNLYLEKKSLIKNSSDLAKIYIDQEKPERTT
jgi:hypothetical protein